MPIRLHVMKNHEEASRHVAEMFQQTIREAPASVLGLATGGTPERVYELLCQFHREDGLSFSDLTTFNLDEYLGLPAGHDQSYRSYMTERLFGHVDVNPDRVHLPRVDDFPPDEAARQYEALLQQTGHVDLQLLGIGTNGHIGFNEPGSARDSVTRVVDLTEETIRSNSRYFEDESDVPRRAVTMGIATILKAKRVVLLATGGSKSRAVAEAFGGPITDANPASFLQEHGDAVFVLDEAAADGLAGILHGVP